MKPCRCGNSGRSGRSDFCRQRWLRRTRTLRDSSPPVLPWCWCWRCTLLPLIQLPGLHFYFPKHLVDCQQLLSQVQCPSLILCLVLLFAFSLVLFYLCEFSFFSHTVNVSSATAPAADDDVARSVSKIDLIFLGIFFFCLRPAEYSLFCFFIFSFILCPTLSLMFCVQYQLAFPPSTWWKCGNQRVVGGSWEEGWC